MFSVIFEVRPKRERWEDYLGNAKLLRPELERIEGFVDNTRYRSLTSEGWILSLSNWRDEKSVVRWRTRAKHHAIQEKGRSEIFSDYHLRVGQVTQDTHPPAGLRLEEQRLDETEVGSGKAITLIDIGQKHSVDLAENADATPVAASMGFKENAPGLVGWDVFDAVLTPGDLILLLSWKNKHAAADYAGHLELRDGARFRQIRVVRDYGMYDRREAPQYYPDVTPVNKD